MARLPAQSSPTSPSTRSRSALGRRDKVYRDALELESRRRTCSPRSTPTSRAGRGRDRGGARRARVARLRAALLGAPRGGVEGRRDHRQPVPARRRSRSCCRRSSTRSRPPGADACVVCANGKVFPMSESDIEQKIGKDNLARMERLGIEFLQNEPRNADAYDYVGVSSRGTPVWLHNEVAACDVKITIGQAQANHWGAGGGGKLILPGVVSDETIESNHCAFVPSPQTHYGALRGPDALGHRRGRDDVRARLHDERRPRHARPRARVHLRRRTPRRTAGRSSASTRSTPTSIPGTQADIAICGVFAPTDHLFFHTGWGCMSADFVVKDGGTIIYCSPSPGVSTAIGDFPGLALMDLMKPYMPPTPENYQRVLQGHPRAGDPDVGRLHLGADLRGDDAQAPDARHARGEPRDGRRHRHRRDDVARRGVRGGDGAARAGREGDRPAVRALPAAANMVRMDAERSAIRRRRSRTDAARRSGARRARHVRRSRRRRGRSRARRRSSSCSRMFPDGEAARLMSQLQCRARTAAAPSTSR